MSEVPSDRKNEITGSMTPRESFWIMLTKSEPEMARNVNWVKVVAANLLFLYYSGDLPVCVLSSCTRGFRRNHLLASGLRLAAAHVKLERYIYINFHEDLHGVVEM